MPLLATLAAALSGKTPAPWTDNTIVLDDDREDDAPPPDEGRPVI